MNESAEHELRALSRLLRWHAIEGTTVTAETLGRYADQIDAAVDYSIASNAVVLTFPTRARAPICPDNSGTSEWVRLVCPDNGETAA